MDNEAVMNEIRQDLECASHSCRGKEGCAAVKRIKDNIEFLYTQFVLDHDINHDEDVDEDEDLL